MRGWAAFAVVTGLPALLHVALAAMVGAESDGGGPILASAIIVSAMAGVFAAWSRPALSFAVAVAWPSFMAWSRMYWKIGVSSPAPAAAVFLRNWQGLDLPPSAAYALVLAAAALPGLLAVRLLQRFKLLPRGGLQDLMDGLE